ncbi:MAG: DNA adenine methylase [Phycisphaerae bacterium]
MNIPHPIPYQGSKRRLAAFILRFVPPRCNRLVEPFAGSSAVSLAAAYHTKAQKFLLNDINSPLIQLWEQIINNPKSIAFKYRTLWNQQIGREKEFFNEVRATFNKTQRPDCFLFLLARCAKATIRYNSKGEFNNSPDNRRKGTCPDTMEDNILRVSKLLRGKTEITCRDFREVLKSANSTDLIYMDPPYQGVCGDRNHRYIGGITHTDLIESLELLNKKESLYVLSYDGKSGTKTYGKPLPTHLKLKHLEIEVGRSSQATLLGQNVRTYESIYLSPALTGLIDLDAKTIPFSAPRRIANQLVLFG